jgi:hypothetical protein
MIHLQKYRVFPICQTPAAFIFSIISFTVKCFAMRRCIYNTILLSIVLFLVFWAALMAFGRQWSQATFFLVLAFSLLIFLEFNAKSRRI